MEKLNIFITGATGCLGHYLVDILRDNEKYNLFLLIRDKKNWKYDFEKVSNATILYGDMECIEKFSAYLNKTHYLIHIATSWCGSQSTIIDGPFKMLDSLDLSIVKRVMFFSTASILGRENILLKEAQTLGTGYIKDKYLSYNLIKQSKYKDLVIHIFPTVIIGGDKTHPYTHIGEGLLKSQKMLNLAKYFYIDLGFHYIHAQDIAKIIVFLMENKNSKLDYVVGNDYILLKDFIKELASYFGKKPLLQIKIPTRFINFIIKLFRLKVDPWGYFSLNYRFFKYDITSCHSLKIPTQLDNLESIMQNLEGSSK